MPRYFLEVAYHGKGFSGFQIQENAPTIQSEIEQAFDILFRIKVELTGSSRTDTGVHAYQNYFHFDWHQPFQEKHIYNLNALLPASVVILSVKRVRSDAHARFHADSRTYRYHIYQVKNPFLTDRGWFFPYQLNKDLLVDMAAAIQSNQTFHAFSKRNSQVNTYECTINESRWVFEKESMYYEITANRFLRGMIRGLVGTMVRVARGNTTRESFDSLLKTTELSGADFSAPGKGLFLVSVSYPASIFDLD
jgi:tRNA pseudouridine38-40 synthase